MTDEKIELKSYKVLRQLGWDYATYSEGDTIELEPRFAEFYVNEKVLEEQNEAAPAPEPVPTPLTTEKLPETTGG